MSKKCFFCLVLLLTGAIAQAQTNPVPFLNQPLVPTSAAPGGQGFTLTVNGSGFASTSVVEWNGTSLQTTFLSVSQLTAAVPAAAITTPGTASVTVTSPGPGGGTSSVAFFSISAKTTPSFTDFGVANPQLSNVAPVQYPIAVDLNGDGKLDVVAESDFTGQMLILLGKGDGSFQSPQFVNLPQVNNTGLGNAGREASEGDFNGDGKPDVAIGGYFNDLVIVFPGNGDGTFGTPNKFAVPATNIVDVTAVGDFNQDGKLDLIAASHGDLFNINASPMFSVFLGNGDGTFQNPVNYPTGFSIQAISVGDVNGDGKLDLVTDGAVFLGKGDGTFGSATPFSNNGINEMLLADANGDGKLDVLATDYPESNIDVYLGNGDGTFMPAVSYATSGNGTESLETGDFNADGKLDVAVTFVKSHGLSILYGNGDGTFQAGTPYTAAQGGEGLVSGDFNGDGKLDLFGATEDDYVLGNVLLQGSFPLVSLSPGSLTFAQQAMGTTSAAQTVALTNSGNAALAISSTTITGANAGDYSESSNCGATLAVNASCQVSVTFTPTAQGTWNAALSISDNAPGSPQTVSLTGVTTPAPTLTLSPLSITFPGQYVGTSGLPLTVTATNPGDAPLTITSVTTSSKDFGVLNACGGSLAAGSSCAIGVFFDPASSGSVSGTLTIADNASGSPQTIPLSGSGQDFSFTSSSSSQTVTPGSTAKYTIAVNPIAGFNQTVALSCSGAPTGSTCSLSSGSIALSGSTPASVTVSVTTLGNSAAVTQPRSPSTHGTQIRIFLAICGLPGLLLWGGGWRSALGKGKTAAIYGTVLLGIVCLAMAGCGGNSRSTGGGGTPANTYTLTVTGTFASGSANLTHSTNLTMVVQ